LADLRGRLVTAGYATTDDEPLAGYQRCYVTDPFGNRMELLSSQALRVRSFYTSNPTNFDQRPA